MSPKTGILLRLLGPLIEFGCLAALLKTWNQGYRVAGVRLETFLTAGFGIGLVMIVAGNVLVKRPGSRSKRQIPPLDLD